MARFETGGLWLADHAPAAAGLTLLLLGATVAPSALPLAWAALALAFFGWVAEADGLAVPRPGRVPIRAVGCWETPLAFTVRRGGSMLLFSREENGTDREVLDRGAATGPGSCPSCRGPAGGPAAGRRSRACASSTTSA
jgi:hypothetical protein